MKDPGYSAPIRGHFLPGNKASIQGDARHMTQSDRAGTPVRRAALWLIVFGFFFVSFFCCCCWVFLFRFFVVVVGFFCLFVCLFCLFVFSKKEKRNVTRWWETELGTARFFFLEMH